MAVKNPRNHIMGFSSMGEFGSNVKGTIIKSDFHYAKLIGFSLALASITSVLTMYFIKDYVWDFPAHIVMVVVVLCLDWLAAVGFAWQKGQFQTRLAVRIVPVLMSHILLMVLLHAISNYIRDTPVFASASLPFDIIKRGAVFLILVTNGLSALSNAGRAGWIKSSIVRYITDKVDAFKKATAGQQDTNDKKKNVSADEK